MRVGDICILGNGDSEIVVKRTSTMWYNINKKMVKGESARDDYIERLQVSFRTSASASVSEKKDEVITISDEESTTTS